MKFGPSARRYFADRMQESVREDRREVWRTIATLQQTPPGSETYQAAHRHLASKLRWYVMELEPYAESAAEASPAVRALWHDVELEPGMTGIQAFDIDGFRDDLEPVETLLTVTRAVECLVTVWLDFPHLPPVVEDPWSPDERRSAEEIAEEYDLPERVITDGE